MIRRGILFLIAVFGLVAIGTMSSGNSQTHNIITVRQGFMGCVNPKALAALVQEALSATDTRSKLAVMGHGNALLKHGTCTMLKPGTELTVEYRGVPMSHVCGRIAWWAWSEGCYWVFNMTLAENAS
jgi:hypothetical protein